ncbi:carboxyl-terminal processing protease [Oxalobacteraceae bacterium GrIS 2.11]
MKNKTLCAWLLVFLTAFATTSRLNATQENASQESSVLQPLPQQARAANFAARVLGHENYEHLPFDEKLSSAIFDNYVKVLDPEKVIFLQADIDQFTAARSTLGLAMLNEDLTIPFALYNVRQQRVTERLNYARSLLKHGFDFTQHESLQPDRKLAPFPKSADEINDLWRKRVKNDWLRLKLAGKDDKAIVDILDKRYDNSLKSILRTKGDDVFQTFMDAYATTNDPHTNYFGVRAAESFDISMKLSLTGIGAELQYKDEFVTIRHLVPGSPAALSGKLKAGDRILGVAQGETGPSTDIMGMRLFDAVALIRGAEDSVVRLDVLPAEAGTDGPHKVVVLTRKKITLEKQSAKKSVIEVPDGATTHHIGVISLPGFYRDFSAQKNGEADFKSAARDVSLILEEFKKDKVDGVVLDLRNNGGGSVEEAIELTGLFVDKGPVMQQLDSKNHVSVNSISVATKPVWNGPLGVLINRASASASEIFAAAIQDYGRGVVIGEQSFGKGTTQAIIDLDRIAKNDKPDFGELKMTITKWFRVNGDGIQLRGVTPDLSIPMFTDFEDYGEASFDNALPWSHIEPAKYSRMNDISKIVPALMANHKARLAKDKAFHELQEDIAEIEALHKKNLISLNEADRRKEREAQEAKIKRRDLEQGKAKDGKPVDKDAAAEENKPDDGLLATERSIGPDVESKDNVDKDLLLKEAARIVNDEVPLYRTNHRPEVGLTH